MILYESKFIRVRLTENQQILFTELNSDGEPGEAVLLSKSELLAIFHRLSLHEKGEYPDPYVYVHEGGITDEESQKWHDQQALEG